MNRPRRVGVALVLLAAVLIGLAAATGLALVSMHRADERVDAATSIRLRWVALDDAVAGEAYAEAGYRRAPSPDARAGIERAIDEVSTSADALRAHAGRRDLALVSYLLMLNRRYASEVRRTLDLPRASLTDDRVAGPALDSIRQLIEGSIQGRRLDQADASADRDQLFVGVSVLMPSVFLIALVCLVLSWRMVSREHRRVIRVADTNASLALTDPLTGLANREALRRRLLVELDTGRMGRRTATGSVLLLDLDHFKPVNDTYGHGAGDAVLCTVAERLRELGGEDALAVRLGGDEFALLVPGSTTPEFLAGQIVRNLSRPIVLPEATVAVGTSIGIACYPDDGHSQAELLKAADTALYAAKAAGRGCVRSAGASRQPVALGAG